MAKYLMGIDNGSTAIKAAIYDMQGNEIGVADSKCEMVSPEPGYYERDMDGIWAANCAAIKGAVEKSGIDAKDIMAVSITGHGNGVHLVGEDGKPVYNSIEGMDGRAAGIVNEWNSDGAFRGALLHAFIHCGTGFGAGFRGFFLRCSHQSGDDGVGIFV